MGQHRWSEEQKEFIRDNTRGRSYVALANMFNERFGVSITKTQARGIAYRIGVRCGTRKPYTSLTVEQKEFIMNNACGVNCREFAKTFNERFDTNIPTVKVRSTIYYLGVNAGGPERRGGVNRPAGTETIGKDGIVLVKTARGQRGWRSKHRLVWESTNGPIPDDCVILFGDGNKENFNPDNLILATKREFAFLKAKKLPRDTPELTRASIAIANLYIKLADLKKTASTR